MTKLTSQELEICHILSGIFNYYTSYDEMLGDIKYNVECCKEGFFPNYAYLIEREECFALFRVKQKYKQVAKKVLAIKSNFSQKDLERLFCITASYCLQNKILIDEFSWALEEGWDTNEFIKGIAEIKGISFLRKTYINFRVKNHYKILCFMFGFTRYSFEEQKDLLKKHNSIHFFRWSLENIIMFFMLFSTIIYFLLLASLDFIANRRIVGFILAFIGLLIWLVWNLLDKRQTKNP